MAKNRPGSTAIPGHKSTMSDQDITSQDSTDSSDSKRRGAGKRVSKQQDNSRRPEPTLNMVELRELVELIAAHGFTDFEFEREGFRVRLQRKVRSPKSTTFDAAAAYTARPAGPPVLVERRGAATQESAAVLPSTPPETPSTEEANKNLYTITSPIVGTFYRASSPTAEPFVRVGDSVEQTTVVCIIEAMKLMNEIQAETIGVIEKVYVENAQPVEYGQPLFDVRK